MFGLDEASRELDSSFFPFQIKIFAVILLLVGVIFASTRPGPTSSDDVALPVTQVAGCYAATDQPKILITENGLSVPAQGFGPIDIRVLAVKNTFQLNLVDPLELSADGDELVFRRARNVGTRWFNLYSTAGGAFMPSVNNHPVAGFQILGPNGYVRYRRGPVSDCDGST